MKSNFNTTANKLAELTFSLLGSCQEKELRLAQSYGLTQVEFRCLRLFGLNDSLNNKGIAKKMNLSPSRLTRIIDGLVEKGYVIRNINKIDRRNMLLDLSGKGKALVGQLNKTYVDVHKEILGDIDEKQHQPLLAAMSNMLEALEKWISKS
ncbi:MAG: MarR family winged helix-turn-helix transcriptional regulator [Ignavibacteriaceae bacterium]